MIQSREEALAQIDDEVFEDDPVFTRIRPTRNRTMPIAAHKSSAAGRHRDRARRHKTSGGMHRRCRKKALNHRLNFIDN